VWELDHTQFHLTNLAWPSFFDKIAFDIVKDFELYYAELAHPRLTLYRPGSFVEREKGPLTKDAYGTLLICLPSEHQGADITLSSEGQLYHLSTAHSSAQDLSVMGWTSSFDHQVSRLDSGYRLTISYNLHQTEPVSAPSSRQNKESECVAKILKEWPRNDRIFYKYLYSLDDKSRGRPLSLAGMKGRDREVYQTLNSFCIEAKLFMLFAEITHEVVDNRGVKRISSSIDRVYTADDLRLTSHTSFNAKKELLGFHMDKLKNLEAESSDVENSSLREVHEEGKIIKRYYDTTVVLVHMNHLHLLKLVVLHEIRDYNRSEITEEVPDRGVRGVGMMLGQALKVHPKDMYLKDMVRNAMQSLWAYRLNESADDK